MVILYHVAKGDLQMYLRLLISSPSTREITPDYPIGPNIIMEALKSREILQRGNQRYLNVKKSQLVPGDLTMEVAMWEV